MATNQLRRLRDELGVSQRTFAALFGVTLRTMQAWEGGGPVPVSAKKLLEQAQIFFRVEVPKYTPRAKKALILK